MSQTQEVKVPELGESITEAIIATWLRAKGEYVRADEPIVELETDKITVEVPAPTAGLLVEQHGDEGATVNVGALIATIDASADAPADDPAPTTGAAAAPASPAPTASPAPASAPVMPAARAEAQRAGVDTSSIQGSGRGGRVLKEDVQRAATASASVPAPPPSRTKDLEVAESR